LDYILAVYTYTAYLFIKINKLKESLRFISQAETVLKKLIEYNIEGRLPAVVQAYKDEVDQLYRQYGPYEIEIYDQKTGAMSRICSQESQALRIERLNREKILSRGQSRDSSYKVQSGIG